MVAKGPIVFSGVIIGLIVVIILLAVQLFQPVEPPIEIDFDYLMDLTTELRSQVSEINAVYSVNISFNNGESFVTGEMYFFKNESHLELTYTPEIAAYDGYGILLSPELIPSFIQANDREEYAGELFNNF